LDIRYDRRNLYRRLLRHEDGTVWAKGRGELGAQTLMRTVAAQRRVGMTRIGSSALPILKTGGPSELR
jgi:hypothetical protein